MRRLSDSFGWSSRTQWRMSSRSEQIWPKVTPPGVFHILPGAQEGAPRS